MKGFLIFLIVFGVFITSLAQTVKTPKNLHVEKFVYSEISINGQTFSAPTLLWSWTGVNGADYELRYLNGQMIAWSIKDNHYWQKYKQAFGQHEFEYYLHNNLFNNLLLQAGDTLKVQVRANLNGTVSQWSDPVEFIVPERSTSPSTAVVCHNYPNPFNKQTTIKYFLSQTAKVNLVIFNSLGQKVGEFKAEQPAGYHSYVWNSLHLSSGTYFYLMKIHTVNRTVFAKGKMLLVK